MSCCQVLALNHHLHNKLLPQDLHSFIGMNILLDSDVFHLAFHGFILFYKLFLKYFVFKLLFVSISCLKSTVNS